MSDANMLRLTAHKGIKTIQEKDNHQTSKVRGESSYLLFIFIYFKISTPSTPSTPQTKQNLISLQIWTKKKSKKSKKSKKNKKIKKKNQKNQKNIDDEISSEGENLMLNGFQAEWISEQWDVAEEKMGLSYSLNPWRPAQQNHSPLT